MWEEFKYWWYSKIHQLSHLVLSFSLLGGLWLLIQLLFVVVVTGLFVVVFQLLSHVRLFVTLWIAAHQVSLFFTISWSSLKLMSIESTMPSNHLILWREPSGEGLSSPALNLSQHQDLFLLELFFVVHVFLEDCLFHQDYQYVGLQLFIVSFHFWF